VTGASAPEPPTIRFATVADAPMIAALHASRISEGFLVSLGAAFLCRLYRRIALSQHSFALVADDAGVVCGFVAVSEHTPALYRDFLLRDGLPASIAAARGIARAPRSVFETLRYGVRGRGGGDGGGDDHAEILATSVAAAYGQQGIGARLVRAAVDELERRGVRSARVVTAVGNVAAVRAYERGGFHTIGRDEVHRGVAQELLVWP
jgi:ribosomal protein S18 acetylase RimI-like enzyme